MRLLLDRQGKWQYQVLSMAVDGGNTVELESSADSLSDAQGLFDRQYSKWGLTTQNFYLVDWTEQKILAKHEVFENEFTRFLTRR